jgi:hypothetical protein
MVIAKFWAAHCYNRPEPKERERVVNDLRTFKVKDGLIDLCECLKDGSILYTLMKNRPYHVVERDGTQFVYLHGTYSMFIYEIISGSLDGAKPEEDIWL